MSMSGIASYLVLALMAAACVYEVPNAIDRESEYRAQIAQSRCDKHWQPGYCDNVTMARLYTEANQ